MAHEFMGGSFQHSQEIGLYDIKQSFYQLNPQLSNKTLQDIHDRRTETFHPSPPMIEIVQELICNHYEVALLSQHWPLITLIPFVIIAKYSNKCIQHFSADVGARKPT